MNGTPPSLIIESREHLIGWLGEAAEVEHNLMCCYLYGLFGLKRSTEEGLSEKELEAVERWRRVILGIALEEMNHLTLVANLTTAVGGAPQFGRPNFPVPSGPYPDDLIMELAPFDMETLDHFIFVERPEGLAILDGSGFQRPLRYSREPLAGSLMPMAGNYPTVGSLYQAIRQSLQALAQRIGEKQLFCGCPTIQVGPLESPLPGLNVIRDLESASQALDTIVTQGEGATVEQGSHFARFKEIKREYEELLKENPNFKPGRPAARNPVQRRPPIPEGRVWVTEPLASKYIDMANAIYTLMLRVLVQVFSITGRSRESKGALLETAYTLMHAMASIGEALTRMGANAEQPSVNAGMSFAMLRFLSPLEAFSEKAVLTERMGEILSGFAVLEGDLKKFKVDHPQMSACLQRLEEARRPIEAARETLSKVEWRLRASVQAAYAVQTAGAEIKATAPPPKAEPKAGVQEDASSVERAEGGAVTVTFDAKRCIHSRFCVTLLPKVFKANQRGQWIFPDEVSVEGVAAVVAQCPSGALQYRAREDGFNEKAPEVNLIHLKENGPYAVHAQMQLDGRPAGFRATLCRCGQSKNKPFCDFSHVAAKFQATGEPASLETDMLPERGGLLQIEPTQDGPYKLTGNVEICCGTGRVVLRTQQVKLCRCGHSQSKPICDNSHIAAGFKSR